MILIIVFIVERKSEIVFIKLSGDGQLYDNRFIY